MRDPLFIELDAPPIEIVVVFTVPILIVPAEPVCKDSAEVPVPPCMRVVLVVRSEPMVTLLTESAVVLLPILIV